MIKSDNLSKMIALDNTYAKYREGKLNEQKKN